MGRVWIGLGGIQARLNETNGVVAKVACQAARKARQTLNWRSPELGHVLLNKLKRICHLLLNHLAVGQYQNLLIESLNSGASRQAIKE